jgi:predicted nuclease of predicted toxin-antitoxin system
VPEPREPVTFFLDHNFGSVVVASALREAGYKVEVLGDNFPSNCKDEEWLQEVGRRGWVVLSKDRNFRYRRFEWDAFQRAGVAAFVLTVGDLSGQAVSTLLLNCIDRIQRLVTTRTRPLLVTISRSGHFDVKVGERRGSVKK